MSFQEFLSENIKQIKCSNLYRRFKVLSACSGAYVNYNGRKVLQVSSNNYLGLAGDKRIQKAVIEAVKQYGVGSTGSRLTTGTHELHAKLEEKIAQLKGTESAIVFSSGYDTNVGVLSAILSEHDAVYSDRLNHASIIDGIRLSRADKFVYDHCNMLELERMLRHNKGKYRLNLVVTDSIFSMDGDRAPLEELVQLRAAYGAVLYVDEAHSFGIYGQNGEGLVHELGLSQKIDIQMGTLSKAAGSTGGYIAGNKELIDYLTNSARSFIYSTAPTIPAVAASIKAIELIESEYKLREKLHRNIKYFKKRLKEANLDVIPSDSAIFCINVATSEAACKISEELLNKYDILAVAIRPPTVPTPRIRLCLMAQHSEDDLDYLVKALSELTQRYCEAEPQEANQ
jgi:8-amino-7-oxononanoate synthase